MRYFFVAVVVLAVASTASAQSELIGSGAPTPQYQAGWTLTPTVGVGEVYDNNITLFGINTADNLNNDYITAFSPSADLHYEGAHTQFGADYGGSYLNYRTYSPLDRWDQHANVNVRRQETAHVKWFAHGGAISRPETDLIDFGGIPYRPAGSTEVTGSGGLDYVFGARDTLEVTSTYQDFKFERSDVVDQPFLRGGNILDNLASYRHALSSRLSLGIDYTYRRAMVAGDPEHFDLHGVEAAADYEISPAWSVSGAGGIVYMQSTATFPERTGPAYRLAISRHREMRSFHVTYVDSYIPAFGFGGIIKSRELDAGFHAQLFHSKQFYTDNGVMYREDKPVVATTLLLPLQSFRGYAIFGWQPDRYVRVEAFYVRVDQTSFRPGGQLYRDRVGFQIVTSKPMRIQ